jgi:hypothetical protein
MMDEFAVLRTEWASADPEVLGPILEEVTVAQTAAPRAPR